MICFQSFSPRRSLRGEAVIKIAIVPSYFEFFFRRDTGQVRNGMSLVRLRDGRRCDSAHSTFISEKNKIVFIQIWEKRCDVDTRACGNFFSSPLRL